MGLWRFFPFFAAEKSFWRSDFEEEEGGYTNCGRRPLAASVSAPFRHPPPSYVPEQEE